jgi:protein-disulfide isomerase/type II secretory pathway component PulC
LQQGSTAKESLPRDPNVALAQIGDRVIYQEDVDQAIALQLYDLEWAKYELRREQLALELQKQLLGNEEQGEFRGTSENNEKFDVHVLLQPPMPPRVSSDVLESLRYQAPLLGQSDAPVQLSVFCNYQSSHCSGMQPTYRALQQAYGAQLSMRFVDVPMPFHRYASSAAIAAQCADQQGRFDVFHKALWGIADQLNEENYLLTAKQLGMDLPQFEACQSDQEMAVRIQSNIALAQDLGFRNVPVTLVNGLYVRGPKEEYVLRFMIDQELQRLGIPEDARVASDQQTLLETTLPLRLEGVTVSTTPETGSALIQSLETTQTDSVQVGQMIDAGVHLVAVYEDHVLLQNQGVLERLSMQASEQERELAAQDADEQYIAQIEQAALASGNVLDTDELPPAGLEYQYRGVVAPNGEKPLSKAWIAEQLANQSELEAHFQPAELEVEGVRIMRLEDIDQSEFYKTLGLQENDVIMRVNGEWLHEGQNTLFSSLERGEALSLVLMRKGLPVHYQYSIN